MPYEAPLPSSRLELGTALSHLGDEAEALRRIASELRAVAEDHAMTTLRFLRDMADDRAPSPAALLRSRGQIEALVQQLLDRADAEASYLSELDVAVLQTPEAEDALERRALQAFKDRYRRGRTPDDEA